MPTSTATQSPEGRWLLKVKHDIDRPTLKIPVVLVYDGHSAIDDDDTPITVTNTYPANPVITQWKTPLGQAIDTSKITIKKPLPQVIDGYNIYQVTGITWDSVEPYTAETYSLILSVTPPDLPWDGECQITSIYRKTVDMTGITDTNVTTGTVFSIKDDDGTVSIVSRDGNSYVKANTGKTSTLTKTKSVTIVGKYANEIEGETIVEVQTKTESDVPEDPEEGGGSTTGDTPTVAPEPVGISIWSVPLKIGFFYDIDSFRVKVLPNDLTKEQKKPLIDIADRSFLDTQRGGFRLSWHSENGGFYDVSVSHPLKTGITTVSAITRDGKFFETTTLEAVKEGVYVTSVSPTSVEIQNKSNSLLGMSESREITVNFKFENGTRKKVKESDPNRMMAKLSVDANSRDLVLLKKTQRNRSYANGDVGYLPFIDENGGALDGTGSNFLSLVKNSLAFTYDSEGYVTGGSFKVKILAYQNLGAERSYNVHILGVGNDDKGKTVRVTQPISDKVYEVPARSGLCDNVGEFYILDNLDVKYDVYGRTIDGSKVGYFSILCPAGTFDPTDTTKTKVSGNWISIIKATDTLERRSDAPDGVQVTNVYIKAEPNNTGAARTATITFNNDIAVTEGGKTVVYLKQLA